MAERVYTTGQVAEHLQINVMTVRMYIREGLLKGFLVGKNWRVTDSALQAFIDAAPATRDSAATEKKKRGKKV